MTTDFLQLVWIIFLFGVIGFFIITGGWLIVGIAIICWSIGASE